MIFDTITNIIKDLDSNAISNERKQILQPLITYIKGKVESHKPVRLNFICTHNSRRSHLSQIWAQVMGSYYGIHDLTTYSGGTEATAMFPVVVDTLRDQGFQISQLSEGNNPVYSVKYTDNDPAIIGFSKEFSDDFNPKSEFAAIMTCSSADQGCPIVLGCEQRVAVTFEDPKASDGTPQQKETYASRSLEIATELKYVFSQIG